MYYYNLKNAMLLMMYLYYKSYNLIQLLNLVQHINVMVLLVSHIQLMVLRLAPILFDLN